MYNFPVNSDPVWKATERICKRSWISSWRVCSEQSSGHLENRAGMQTGAFAGLDLDTQLPGSVGAGIVPSPSQFLVAGG
jgi:hypothetical protein